jgi:hypothetical protein
MPDTMAKVVTVPSIDPYTNSGKYFLKCIRVHLYFQYKYVIIYE